jgi:hypothetical protein
VITKSKLVAALASALVAVPLSLFVGVGSAGAVCDPITVGGCGGGWSGDAGLTEALVVLVESPSASAPGYTGDDPNGGAQVEVAGRLASNHNETVLQVA